MDKSLALVDQMAKSTNGRQMRIALLAYKSDKPAMFEMIEEFKRNGILCWTEEQLLPGGGRVIGVARAYEEADFILVLLSDTSVKMESTYQARMKEALNAGLETPDGGIKLIPVRLNDCRVPFILRDYLAVDWYEKNGPMRLVLSFATEWHRRNDEDAWPTKVYESNWE